MKKMRIAAALMAALMVTGCGSSQPSSQPQMNVGIDYNDSSQPETEANSTQSEEAVNDDISVPGLYTEAFQPFYKGMDTLTFDKAKKDVQGISYTAEITNPEGTLTISSDDGDVITAEFCWDMNGVNTLYMLTYTRGDCSFMLQALVTFRRFITIQSTQAAKSRLTDWLIVKNSFLVVQFLRQALTIRIPSLCCTVRFSKREQLATTLQ